ncbi:hypothetical protein K469DRAFT_85377 [Zopfia rhizophila CBS 207.26]|uniref:Uncharacterized protein n=1 Tax=Zopfia rhizophila CBS 207.26 TaxID=1314779 RepID=A0A6A6EDR5_9PEZI|nr:hypothetical protein K469DRAFT_85377 [Zopfia rhizophila CBS 207.26]
MEGGSGGIRLKLSPVRRGARASAATRTPSNFRPKAEARLGFTSRQALDVFDARRVDSIERVDVRGIHCELRSFGSNSMIKGEWTAGGRMKIHGIWRFL